MPESNDEVVGQLAARVTRWGLADVALFALDAFSPLSLLAGQLLWVAQPTLSLLVDARQVGALATLLEEPDGLARLRQGLAAACQPGEGPGPGRAPQARAAREDPRPSAGAENHSSAREADPWS